MPKAKEANEDRPHVLRLEDLDLTQKLSGKEYDKKLEQLQVKLVKLQRKVVDKKLRIVLVFEGMDAAGKGGAIKRLMQFLDPRGIEVHAIGAPSEQELAHHYLRRFWLRLPPKGRIAIFDRSWYGRLLVEPIEGLCTTDEYYRAFKEIREFERKLADDGYQIAKFWMHVDKDEQLKRFESRKDDPLKKWKLTEEDWRNREKYNEYANYANAMFAATNTPHAPWHMIAGNDKQFARIEVMRIVVDTISNYKKGK